MSDTTVVAVIRDALGTVLLVSAPMLGIGLVVGLVISVFQATTQIQEQTLTFVPKIIAVFVAMVVFGPWMLRVLVEFTGGILGNLHQVTSW
ncbi:MAG TPA: flagellar biosynthesis protein FliQ [Firmicutes bacterium]|jgi:flagellar biosynthetic protein FliQ|nr:flagellar biosynthesis protein FliQ [Bacillota bacterium]HOQ23561.1 flagellar biosynthesis protein FliQ [Bacillota bacterium]HPT67266.1 flagellar biosynthesis protein FliQ [Bacillota bacterium]